MMLCPVMGTLVWELTPRLVKTQPMPIILGFSWVSKDTSQWPFSHSVNVNPMSDLKHPTDSTNKHRRFILIHGSILWTHTQPFAEAQERGILPFPTKFSDPLKYSFTHFLQWTDHYLFLWHSLPACVHKKENEHQPAMGLEMHPVIWHDHI